MAKFAKLFKKEKERGTLSQRMMGDFMLGATLGIGGYAKVKLGVHKETGQKVALKLLFADKNGNISESKKKQTNRAIDLLSKVKHANVLRMLAYEKDALYPESDGTQTPCMMMALEYAGNGELFDYLMFTGFFDEVIARSYFHQLVAGLEAIHGLGYAHRDLKPENLLLDSDFTLKIADFGFATVFTESKMKTACGTKGYLAPEVLKGRKYEESVDIFAAGIILFITYAGFPPFNDAIPTDWWWNRLENGWKERRKGALFDKKGEWSKHGLFWAAHERTRRFPRDLKDFILKMLHCDPMERPSLAQIRNEDWDFYRVPAKIYGSKEKQSKPSRQTVSWFNKEVKETKELGKYLEKRRAVVRKERVKKVQEQQKDLSAEFNAKRGQQRGGHGNGEENKEDGYDSKKETFVEYNVRQTHKNRAMELDPKGEFEKFIQDFSDGLFASTPFYFFTKFKPGIVASVFEMVAVAKNAKVEVVPKESRTTVRCQTQSAEMPLEAEFEVRQYAFGEKFVVSCKRLRGDPLAYKRIINEFWDSKEVLTLMDTSEEPTASAEEEKGNQG